MKVRPSVNFGGLEGWRRPILTHSTEKIGARRMTKKGVNDCSQLDGKRKPKISCARAAGRRG